MKGFGFSVKGLLAAVALVAVGVYCLVSVSSIWLGVLISMTIVLFGTAVLNSVYRQGSQRAFWLGWCVFGGVAVLVTDGLNSNYVLFEYLSYILQPALRDLNTSQVAFLNSTGTAPDELTLEHVQSSLRLLSTLLFGAIGGLVASYTYAAQKAKRE